MTITKSNERLCKDIDILAEAFDKMRAEVAMMLEAMKQNKVNLDTSYENIFAHFDVIEERLDDTDETLGAQGDYLSQIDENLSEVMEDFYDHLDSRDLVDVPEAGEVGSTFEDFEANMTELRTSADMSGMFLNTKAGDSGVNFELTSPTLSDLVEAAQGSLQGDITFTIDADSESQAAKQMTDQLISVSSQLGDAGLLVEADVTSLIGAANADFDDNLFANIDPRRLGDYVEGQCIETETSAELANAVFNMFLFVLEKEIPEAYTEYMLHMLSTIEARMK